MLRSALELCGYHIEATDGSIGKARDLYFDDSHWGVRYLVVDTGNWLPGRRVLISPMSLEQPDWTKKVFPVALTREQIENSPSVDTDQPVSRQLEMDVVDYFSWPVYWPPAMTPVAIPDAPLPDMPPHADAREESGHGSPAEPHGDPHLRSMRDVAGYHIQAQNGEIGHIEDFIVDDVVWSVRYIVVDTRNWLPGRKVLLAPDWFTSFDWRESKAHTGLTLETIKDGPEYDPTQPVNRDYEGRLYDFLGRPGYWTDSTPPATDWKV